MKKNKLIALTAAVVLAATAVVGGTLAYFTDTEKVDNKFTVGNVDIELTESDWDSDASHNLMPGTDFKKNPTIKVKEKSQPAYVFLEMDMNKYISLLNLMGIDAFANNIGGLTGDYPGLQTFCQKLDDDTIFHEVFSRWFKGVDQRHWIIMNEDSIFKAINDAATQDNPKHLKVIFAWYEKDETVGTVNHIMEPGESETFMTGFGMPETVESWMFDEPGANFNSEKASFNMAFTAYAIQSEGIDSLEKAYTNLFKK